MTKAEILAQLPKLSAKERGEILERLWEMEKAAGPTPREKALLDEAQAGYDEDRNAGAGWLVVRARLKMG